MEAKHALKVAVDISVLPLCISLMLALGRRMEGAGGSVSGGALMVVGEHKANREHFKGIT